MVLSRNSGLEIKMLDNDFSLYLHNNNIIFKLINLILKIHNVGNSTKALLVNNSLV